MPLKQQASRKGKRVGKHEDYLCGPHGKAVEDGRPAPVWENGGYFGGAAGVHSAAGSSRRQSETECVV